MKKMYVVIALLLVVVRIPVKPITHSG